FEKEIPAWKDFGNRGWLQPAFEKFYDTYSGVRPAGAWAKHFRIIAWPITHAILPQDLQRQFLESLFRLRFTLRSEHFEDTELLAKTIEASSLRLTDRFRNFLNNRALVWQLSAALLENSSELEDQLIRKQTLERIVGDLEREQ